MDGLFITVYIFINGLLKTVWNFLILDGFIQTVCIFNDGYINLIEFSFFPDGLKKKGLIFFFLNRL
jgi:hypothetical protein